MDVRFLTERDAEALWKLRLQALESQPEAFGESPEEHRQTTLEAYPARLRACNDENFIIGGFIEADLVGMVGFNRELRLKRRHRGGIWGMFCPAGRPRPRPGCGIASGGLDEGESSTGFAQHLPIRDGDPGDSPETLCQRGFSILWHRAPSSHGRRSLPRRRAHDSQVLVPGGHGLQLLLEQRDRALMRRTRGTAPARELGRLAHGQIERSCMPNLP